MTVIRIHAEVAPVLVVDPHQPMRTAYWRGARNYWTRAKEARRSGQAELAAAILASARQALTIATAADPKATLGQFVAEDAGPERETCFVETDQSEPIPGTPAPLRCPFCGDPDMVSITERAGPESEHGASYIAECQGCGAEGPSGSTQLEAAIAWNKRPDRRQEAGR